MDVTDRWFEVHWKRGNLFIFIVYDCILFQDFIIIELQYHLYAYK